MLNLAARARPYFGAVVVGVLSLSVAGAYCATRMPSGIYPEVAFPRLAVVARKPGLAVPNMEVEVTQPLERAVSTVIGVSQVRSKTIRGGSELSIDFSPGTDMRRAEQLTWNRIGAARSQLPAELDLNVEQMTPSVSPIMSLVLIGGDSSSQLRDYAFYELAPLIKNVPDVLYANVAGGDVREIEVEPRPDDLLAAGLSAADLADAIGRVHRLEPVGRIETPPFAFQILVNTQAETARQIEQLVVATRNHQPLRVRDLADVRVGHQDRVMSVGYAGRDAVVISVFRRLGGNTVDVSRNIRALLEKQPLPRNIRARVVYDQAVFVQTAVANVRDAILVGGIFSVVILLGFLRSWRATIISALAIPTTLAITFLILYWTGETLNLMSLGGLAVAIGLVIDDTVVVIENIARHLHESGQGSDPVDAGSAEITGAVVGSTLTTVLVFVPLAFIVGVYGQFFASLSWSLATAVLVSMVISLTLVPVLAARFLAGKPMPQPGRVYRFTADAYEAVLSLALRFPWTTLALSAGVLLVGVVLYFAVPTGLMPAMDEGAFTVDYWAPSGTSLEATEAMAREIEGILSDNPDVDAYVRRTGSEMGLFATQTHRGDIQVVLRPAGHEFPGPWRKPVRPELDEIAAALAAEHGKETVRAQYRRRPADKVMDEVEGEIKESFAEHQLKVELIQIMQDELGDLSGANKPVEVKLFGPDYAELRRLASEVGNLLETKGHGKGLREVNSNVFAGNPDLMIRVAGARAAHAGLTAEAVERQLTAMYLGQVATRVRESAVRLTDVRVRYADALRFGSGRFDPQRLLGQWIVLPDDPTAAVAAARLDRLAGPTRAVPLAALADVDRVRSPDEQWRENQQPAIFVTADLDEEEAGLNEVVSNIRRWMAADVRMPAGYRWELGGHYVQQQDAFASLLLCMVVAVFLVFLMLAFQFRSVALPLVVFMTQPLSLVSGLFALWLTGTPLNISSFMGAILLIGLDMKNGIILVEYIQQLLGRGMKLREALVQAGRTRFRPILMTSLAAILGLFPLALGIGPGAQMQQPLAIMVIGGLTANMLFTRAIIPVGYLVLERGRKIAPPAAAV